MLLIKLSLVFYVQMNPPLSPLPPPPIPLTPSPIRSKLKELNYCIKREAGTGPIQVPALKHGHLAIYCLPFFFGTIS
jgi:hypothetical protein